MKLKDITSLITDYVANGSFASLKSNVKYVTSKEGYARVIRLTDENSNYDISNAVFVTKEAYDFLAKSQLNSGDIIITNVGAYLGTVFQCPNLNIPMTLGPNSILIRPNSKVINKYLYYSLLSNYGHSKLLELTSGSAMPKFNKTDLRNMEVEIHSLDIQQHIVDTIGSLDDLLENLKEQKDKIIFIIQEKLKEFTSGSIDFSELKPEIIKSGIYSFDNEKFYIDTSSVEGINNISNGEIVTFKRRPSRANMQPVNSSVWFAKMKGSNKIILVTDRDGDLIDNNIFSTGFLGIKGSDKLPISYLMAIITSKEFETQRDLNSVGTTMAGINNNTLLKINVPKLDKMSFPLFKEICNPLVLELSNIRRKTNSIKKLKERLLEKYF